jgi:putative peptidoglycan lipid II flippase
MEPIAGPPAASTQPDAPIARPELAPGLNRRGMISATVIVMIAFVLSRVTGLLREAVISGQFGTSAEYDAYLAAFRVPDLLFQLAAGGALASAFIPTFAGLWLQEDKRPAWQLFSRVLSWVLLALSGLALLALLFAEPLIDHVLAPGFSAEQVALSAGLMRWMLISTLIFGASGLIMGALNTANHFLAPAIAPVVYNLAIIGGAWFLAPQWGIYGLVAGVVAGAVGHLLVQLPPLLRQGVRFRPGLAPRDPLVRQVAVLMGPRVLGLFFVQMHFVVNTMLASSLAAGSLSALNYAWLLMLLPQGIIGQAIATVAFPTFAAQVAAQRADEMRRAFERTLSMVFFLVAPAAVALLLLRRPAISLLLERGEFGFESMQMVAFGLQFYVLGLVAHTLLEIIVRGFFALQDTWTPVAVGIAAMSVNIGLSFLLVGPLSFGGLALANSVATTAETLLLLAIFHRRLGGLDLRSLLHSAARTTSAALLMGAVLWLIGRWIYESVYLAGVALNDDLLTLVGGGISAVIVYAALSAAMRSPDLAFLTGAVRRRTNG